MKKVMIAIVGLLLMFSYGCSSDDSKTTTEKAKEVITETADKAATATKDAATATKEAATATAEKATEAVKDATKPSN